MNGAKRKPSERSQCGETFPAPPHGNMTLDESGVALSTSQSDRPFWRTKAGLSTLIVLVCILIVASILRMVKLGQSPTGTSGDESNLIWDAYCLLKMGKDHYGKPWPFFYFGGLGENRAALMLYVLMPFQAVFGMSIWSARLTVAVLGVTSVFLMYVIGSRMFNRATGLVAAGMLALNPWHIYYGRLVNESNPFFLFLPLTLLVLAGLPFQNAHKRVPRPLLAGVAGAVVGLACYSYPGTRLSLPVFILAAVLVAWRGWWNLLRTRKGAVAICAMVICVSVTFGPLVWKHVTDPAISKRGKGDAVWNSSDSLGSSISQVFSRYRANYGVKFLFVGEKGRVRVRARIPDTGQFHWYMLPLFVVGLLAIGKNLRSSYAARILLVWVVLYPISDIFFTNRGPHPYRSAPGIPFLILLGAFGAVSAGSWLAKRNRLAFIGAVCLSQIAVGVSSVRLVRKLFFDYNQQPQYRRAFYAEYVEAFEWLRPRLEGADAVFCTGTRFDQGYVISLVALQYDPKQWFLDHREYKKSLVYGKWDLCIRYGKINFMYGSLGHAEFDRLVNNGRKDHVYLIVRPGELQSASPPIYIIPGPNREALLCVYECLL